MKFLPEYNKRHLNGIYIIRNTIDSRVYIGECKNFYKRWSRHKSSLMRNIHCNPKLQAFVNKYGIDKLEFDILEEVNDNRIDREIYYIQLYDSINNGFNIILDSRIATQYIDKEILVQNGKKVGNTIVRDEEYIRKLKEGVRLYYKNNPKKPRAKWTEERRKARVEYIASHKENYVNRKPSSGNKINHKRGSELSNTNLTEEIVSQIKENIRNGVKRSITLETFNISAHVYKDIQRGKTWKHVV